MNARAEKYLSVFNIGLQNTFVYRWNYFLRAAFGLIPLAGTVFLWNAVFKERAQKIIPAIHERVLEPDVEDRNVFVDPTRAHAGNLIEKRSAKNAK